jgi:hypothetical protein
MAQDTIYLKTTLFATGGRDTHIPTGVQIIEGNITAQQNSSVSIQTTTMHNGHGKMLTEVALTLQIPLAKIDHIHHRD